MAEIKTTSRVDQKLGRNKAPENGKAERSKEAERRTKEPEE
jgi:hypothetical protein